MKRNTLALISLLLISPFIGELVTGNTPVGIFFTPVMFIMTVLLYGVGAVLVSETATRWGKGFASIFLLGLAYGAIEEGLITKGFFDPHFYAVIAFGMENFGRVGGINALWAISIMLFHAIFSIAIPIIIVNALFGTGQRLSARTYVIFLAIFAINAFVFSGFLAAHGNTYAPDAGSVLITWVVIALLVVAARLWPASVAGKQAPSSLTLCIDGFLLSMLYFLLSQGFHNFIHNAFFNGIVLIGFVLVSGRWLRRFSFSVRDTIALVTGLMIPLFIVDIIGGRLPVALLMLTIMLVAWHRAKLA